MKHKAWLLFILPAAVALCPPLFAQSPEDGAGSGSRIANVKVWVAPVEGGTEEEREYFDFNMPEEVKGSGYQLAESVEDSDFYILFSLEHDEEYGDEMITAELYTTKTGALIISNTMGYAAVEDMTDWNLTMIYQLMANAPLHKYINTIEQEVRIIPPKPILGFPEYWLYVGLRGGYSIRRYLYMLDEGQIRKDPWGHSFEAGIQVSFQPLRFLAIQAEFLFTNDSVPLQYGATSESGFFGVDDAYQSYSLTIPLTIKGTFHLYDRLVLNPFSGVYFMAPLGTIKGKRIEPDGTGLYQFESNYTYSLPIGWTAGLEVGWVLGKERNRGTIFLDFRYSADLGKLVLEDDTAVYKRTGMVSITAGYRFGFFKRNKQAPASEELPEDFDFDSFNSGL
ncbi:hypothetical protein AGMMS49944_17910 [Spirochaetia bacterium]|nr:hypothetical protein AGMMS49944_17910 [Spirochaetia bacterium]